jgi:hypothetical protein
MFLHHTKGEYIVTLEHAADLNTSIYAIYRRINENFNLTLRGLHGPICRLDAGIVRKPKVNFDTVEELSTGGVGPRIGSRILEISGLFRRVGLGRVKGLVGRVGSSFGKWTHAWITLYGCI